MKKFTSLEVLIESRTRWRSKNRTVVWIDGYFNVLKSEHVRMLLEARSMGDVLVVGINAGPALRRDSATDERILPPSDRAELVASLECVDNVIVVNSVSEDQILRRLRPDVYCAGPDACPSSRVSPDECEIVKSYGGRVAVSGLSQTSMRAEIAGYREDPRGDADSFATTSLVDRFSCSRAVVVGDVMLDEYVCGSISRISPEAPVPILDVSARRFTCGGAANVAANVASLSGVAFLSGLIGRDLAGTTLRRRLLEYGIQLEALIESESAQTICKTRFVAGQQQIVRVDQESRKPLTEPERNQLLDEIKQIIPGIDVCVLSDYAKGLLDERMCQDLIGACQEQSKATIVDPKGSNFRKYRGCSLITPNLKEAGIAAGCEIKNEDDLRSTGAILLEMLPGTSILITRGPDGMTLFRDACAPLSVPTVARKVFDVVGAGDTAVATLAVAIGARFDIEDAIRLANIAAGVAVEQHGTVAVGIDELAARPEALQVFRGAALEYYTNVAIG